MPSKFGAAFTVKAKLGAGVLAEIEFQMAVQVLLIDVLIDNHEAAIQNAEEAFKSVGVSIANHSNSEW